MSASAPPGTESGRRARVLLGLGAGAGLVLAAVGLVLGPSETAPLSQGVVARINGEPLSAEVYQRALAALAADRRDPLDAEAKRRVLDRLIDEELLVQRGLELSLARHDRRVRADLVSAVIEGVVAEADDHEPPPEEIQLFYSEEGDYFVQPGRMRVRQLMVRAPRGRDDTAAAERAREVAVRLREAEDPAAVAAALGDPPLIPLPDALLPAPKLREYLGPTAMRTALGLEVGEVGGPVRTSSGYLVLQMLEREPERVPPLDEIREQVRAELRRRGGDRALRSYLERLRARAELHVVESLP